jgi:hypothetical protein
MKTNSRRELASVILRWVARAASLISIALILMFLIGDRFNPASVRPTQWIGLALFPTGVVIGMLVAWWKEVVGACITLTSLAGFYAVYGWFLGNNVNSLAFLVFASPALLFLVTWLLSKSSSRKVTA